MEAFIRERLAADPRATHTGLLRAFREGGCAFEYTRFRGVFARVRADMHAPSNEPLFAAAAGGAE